MEKKSEREKTVIFFLNEFIWFEGHSRERGWYDLPTTGIEDFIAVDKEREIIIIIILKGNL